MRLSAVRYFTLYILSQYAGLIIANLLLENELGYGQTSEDVDV